MPGKFYIPPDKRLKLSVDELACKALEVLQHNDRMSPTERSRVVSYYPFQLSSIRAFELTQHGEQRDRAFDNLFAEAKAILYRRGYVIADPGQSADDFVILTEAGKFAETNGVIVGLTSPVGCVDRIEVQTGRLDATARQYLLEAFSAADAELWLSAAFMLGGSAERLLILLSVHCDALLADPAKSADLASRWQVRRIKEWVVDQLPALKRKYASHSGVFTDVEDKIDGLFALYRYERNDAGHPKDSPYKVDVNQTKAMLLSFGTFATSVTDILKILPKP